MVRAEIRHGYFLAYMINPRKPHGFGDRIIRAFLEAALDNTSEEVAEIARLNLGSVQVRREWNRVDLLVILPVSKIIVAVELKIDAFQSDHQLADYRAKVQGEWPSAWGWRHEFLFLTKRGEVSKDNWRDLPMAMLISRLEAHSSEDDEAPGATMLRDYTRMMRRHHVGDELTVELARKLWSEHGDVLDFLAKNRPMPIRALLEALKETGAQIAESASVAGMTIVEDTHATSIVRFGISEWDSVKGFNSAPSWTPSKRIILLEMKPSPSGIDAFAFMGPSKTAARKQISVRLNKAGLIPQTAAEGEGWSLLLKAEIFRPVDPLGFELDEAISAVSQSFSQFASRLFEGFDPVIRK